MTSRALWIRRLAIAAALACCLAHPAPALQKLEPTSHGEIRPDKALVYFLRSPSWGKGVESLAYVYADQEIAAVLPKNSYTYTQMEPGTHLLWNSAAVRERGLTDLSSTRDVEFVAGKAYYVVLNYKVAPHVHFAVLDTAEGEALMARSRSYVVPDDDDLAQAAAFRDERFPWIRELQERQQPAPEVVWRMPEEERAHVLCNIRTIFVDEVRIDENAEGRLLPDAEAFGNALRKRLVKLHFKSAKVRSQADAVLASRVDKRRQETRGNLYKNVSSAAVSLLTLEGQEIWRTEVDTGSSKLTVNAFNTWSQLARQVVVRLRDECRDH